jgi:hypothetical protein
VTPQEAREIAWRSGVAPYALMTTVQEDMHVGYASSRDARVKKFLVNCSRRLGKSFWLCLEASVHCLTTPNAVVRYAAPTGAMVEEIIHPHIRVIFEDAPEELVPKWDGRRSRYVFPSTGAQWSIAGCEDRKKADRLRGTAATLCIVDEGGFIPILDYVVDSVLMPQLMTTDGNMLIASTPPETPAHPFRTYCIEAQTRGSYTHKTIDDATHIPERVREEYINEAGGRASSKARREYFAEFVVDESSAVIPEWNADVEAECVRDWPVAPYRDFYVSMDLGYTDLTVALFGWWDFARTKYVIEDELVLERPTSLRIADGVKAKELERWGEHARPLRYSDTDMIVLADLSLVHRLPFAPTAKDDKEGAINAVRLAVQRRELVIHPRCTTLLTHLRHAIWNRSRSDFERSDGLGHFDAIDALVYFVRNVNRLRNPYPELAAGIGIATHHVPKMPASKVGQLARMVGRRA